MTAGACPGCGGTPGRHHLFCAVCWSEIPNVARATLERAWSALKRLRGKTGSRRAQADFDAAVASAASHVRGAG